MNYSRILKMTFGVLLSLNTTLLHADVRLPGIISDNMVFQRDADIRIWGWADPKEEIEAEFADQVKHTVADANGNWMIKFNPVKAGGPFALVIKGNNRITLKNILVGEVWLCSGQSNMEWPVMFLNNREEVQSTSHYPKIRLFQVRHVSQGQPADDCGGGWTECGPQTVGGFAAVGYFYGRELHKKLNVPVGLIRSTWSGSAAESWIRRDILDQDPAYSDIIERHNVDLKRLGSFGNIVSTFLKWERKQTRYIRDVEQANREGRPLPEAPAPLTCQPPNFLPAGLYNGMIGPLQKLVIKGVIWYQGESNAFDVPDGSDGVHRARQYARMFPELIQCWRKDWGIGDFPFYYVQIAPFGDTDVYKPYSAALVREAQLKTLRMSKNTGMVVTMDIGDVNDIHPRNKHEVGRRLALWSLSRTYQQPDIVYSGPLYKSMKIDGRQIRLSFDHTGSGLISRNGPLTHFTIAGNDHNFVQAGASIEGDTIVVSSEEVDAPIAVRYAWSNAAVPNLFNKEGLPASPFRTDDWTELPED